MVTLHQDVYNFAKAFLSGPGPDRNPGPLTKV